MKKITKLTREDIEVYQCIEDWNELQELSLIKQLLFILFKKKFYNYVISKKYETINSIKEINPGVYEIKIESIAMTYGDIKTI